MACDYHLHVKNGSRAVKNGSRAGGQSATAHHDYITRSGKYAGRDDELQFVITENLPGWAGDAPEFFAAADLHERANGRLYTGFDGAIPHVFTDAQAVAFAQDIGRRVYGTTHPYTLAMHSGRPRDPGDPRPQNRHLHGMASERELDGIERRAETHFKRANKKHPAQGGAAKTPAMSDRGWVEHVRKVWEECANEHLERGGYPDRIDRRTLGAQRADALARGDHEAAARLDRPPARHRGPVLEHRPEAAPDRALVFADAEAERRAAIRLAEEQAEKEEAIARHTDDRIRLARQLDEALSEVIESMPAAARADALAHTAAAPRAAPPPPPAPRKALEGETLDRVIFRAIPADIRTEVLAHVAAPPRAAPTPELAKPVIVEDMRARVQRTREVADPPPPPPVTIQDLAAEAAAARERAADARAEAEKRLQAAADQAEAERARAKAEERAQADADPDADPDADRAQADADQAAADADQAAAERAAAERAEAARRRFQDASAAALEATRGPAADIADAWPRNVEAGDVAEALDRLHATAYQEQIEVDGAELAVGELRMGVELEISDAAEEMRHAARPVPEAERGAAVASIVRAIQDAAVRLVERVLDHVMPGRARRVEDSPPTAATHETATTAKPQPSPEPSPARPTTEHKPEDMPERGAGEDAGGVRRGDQPRDPTTIEH